MTAAARALALYRVAFSGLIMAASVVTLARDPVDHAHLLAVPEIIGAVLLLSRRSEIAGAGILLIVFVTAETLVALKGQWAAHFLQYVASVIFIVLQSRTLSIQDEQRRISENEHHST